MEKAALKRLTASDLTFFEWQFRYRNAGNQKSINLNADIFVDQLYPAAPDMAPSLGDEIPISLTLFGPGLAGSYPLARKIVKAGSYKNWRLNGEFVHNPDDATDRFNILEPGDLVLFVFSGEPLPTRLNAVFISARVAEDTHLHSALSPLVPAGRESMIRITRAALSEAALLAGITSQHPVQPFLADPEFESALEDAAFGSEDGVQFVRRRPGRRVSAMDLAKARIKAEQVGRDGEGLIYVYLAGLAARQEIGVVEWIADTDAAAPFDFRITSKAGEVVKLDVKSTSGKFDRAIHISAAEIAEAANASER